MAGITKITAYIIATRGDDVKISAAFHKPTGKWVGWITLGPEDRYRPLLDSGPYYNSEEETLAAMKQCVADIRKLLQKKSALRNQQDKTYFVMFFQKPTNAALKKKVVCELRRQYYE